MGQKVASESGRNRPPPQADGQSKGRRRPEGKLWLVGGGGGEGKRHAAAAAAGEEVNLLQSMGRGGMKLGEGRGGEGGGIRPPIFHGPSPRDSPFPMCWPTFCPAFGHGN